MATGDYCTLAQLKKQILNSNSYSAATFTFTASSKTIADSAQGLKRFQAGQRIQITGSVSNNGFYTVATGDTAASMVVNETLVNEVAGATVVISDVSDPTDDTLLAAVITAVSRSIDQQTGRFFYKKASETRYYSPLASDILYIDDCIAVTSLATDDGDRTYPHAWTLTDYDLMPFNAAAQPEPEPYSAIARTPNGQYWFPHGTIPYAYLYGAEAWHTSSMTNQKSVKVVGDFGWSATPAAITQACLIQSVRIFKRKDAPYGVLGSADMGTLQVIPKLDPDVALIVNNYRKNWFG